MPGGKPTPGWNRLSLLVTREPSIRRRAIGDHHPCTFRLGHGPGAQVLIAQVGCARMVVRVAKDRKVPAEIRAAMCCVRAMKRASPKASGRGRRSTPMPPDVGAQCSRHMRQLPLEARARPGALESPGHLEQARIESRQRESPAMAQERWLAPPNRPAWRVPMLRRIAEHLNSRMRCPGTPR